MDNLIINRVRPWARFCVIFHTKILKNAQKSGARVLKTHVGKEKRMEIMDTRLRFNLLIKFNLWCARCAYNLWKQFLGKVYFGIILSKIARAFGARIKNNDN